MRHRWASRVTRKLTFSAAAERVVQVAHGFDCQRRIVNSRGTDRNVNQTDTCRQGKVKLRTYPHRGEGFRLRDAFDTHANTVLAQIRSQCEGTLCTPIAVRRGACRTERTTATAVTVNVTSTPGRGLSVWSRTSTTNGFSSASPGNPAWSTPEIISNVLGIRMPSAVNVRFS